MVSSEGIVYECISYSCGSYGFEPGSLSTSNLWREGWKVVGSCIDSVQTSTPTHRQTMSFLESPSASPSSLSSSHPSSAPIPSPESQSPTHHPIAFAGSCRMKFVPLSYYPIGTHVSRDNVIYECISFSCGTYGFEPGSSDLWIEGWKVIGSCIVTITPSSMPSNALSEVPSVTVSSVKLTFSTKQPRRTFITAKHRRASFASTDLITVVKVYEYSIDVWFIATEKCSFYEPIGGTEYSCV